MTFKQLRKRLEKGPQVMEWQESKIVEVASLTLTGAVRITNAVSHKSFLLPRKYDAGINVRVLKSNDYIMLGQLLPKDLK